MAHPQNSPRGLFIKEKIQVDDAECTDDSSGNLLLSAGLALSGQSDEITQTASVLKVPVGLALSGQTDIITQTASAVKLPVGLCLSGKTDIITQNSTAVALPVGLKLSGQSKTITQTSTGVVLPTVTAIPSARAGNGTISIISDDTGQCVVINQTGTTWVYLSTTSVRPS